MLRALVLRTARAFGVELRRFHPDSSQAAQLRAVLASHKINLVFDVGANTGQYARELRSHVGYRGRIVSFEPLAAAHRELCRAARGDPLWEVAGRAAIGAAEGTATLNVAGNSVSSSILPMLDSHANAAPHSRYQSTETVPVKALDSIAPDYLMPGSIALLKIDTQGYEQQVLEGAPRLLSQVAGVQLELSLVPLYAGQALMPDLLAAMDRAGFNLWGISPMFSDPATGRMLQADGLFFRK